MRSARHAPVESSLFSGATKLSVESLVAEVLARNPNLAQMTATWQAASARYPQVTSLDDPMFGTIIGPASIGSNDVDFAYRLEASQKIPFCGKLRLRGQTALAEAAAAGNDVDDIRLQLIESTKTTFYDYYLVHRAIAVNDENLRLLRELLAIAEDRVKASQAPQQDMLQAQVEIGRQRERGLALERMRKVTQARLNTLMHLPPDNPLPPPPKTLELGAALPDVAVLRSQALSQRPDLQALANRIEAERTSLGLADKDYYPDFEVMAAYDAFWQPAERDLRPMVGVRLNVPIQRERRRGAVAEMQARLAQRVAELTSRTDQVNLQVQEAYEQVLESEKAVRLYDDTILPAANRNVQEARQAYVANRIPFLSLIEAQRNLVELRDRYYEAFAEYYRRQATLERVIGSPPVHAP
jgi:cobalt-zinc-cadmium efflux system outer membrane protein